MPFQVSPGVNVSEIDLTTVIPAVATTEGALAGIFRWGPVDEVVLVSSEQDLAQRFGAPTALNYETFFTAADFLAYGNKLYVVRTANTTSANTDVSSLSAYANSGTVTDPYSQTVKNLDDYSTKTFDADVEYVAKYPGSLGNSLKVSVCDSTNAYSKVLTLAPNAYFDTTNTAFTLTVGSNTTTVTIWPANTANTLHATGCETVANNIIAGLTVGDFLLLGNTTTGSQYMKISAIGSRATGSNNESTFTLSFVDKYNQLANFTLSANADNAGVGANGQFKRFWEYFDVVDTAPGQSAYQTNFGNTSVNDELHIVVSDAGGDFTGVPGTVLEVFRDVSRATDAQLDDGTNNYYKTVVNNRSNYMWWASDRSGANSGTAAALTPSTNETPYTKRFVNGNDGASESNTSVAIVIAGYDKFKSPEDVDVSLVLQGKAIGGTHGATLANYIIDNIAGSRKDCVAFISPAANDTVDVLYNDDKMDNVIEFRNQLSSTSYAVMDSGYKYRYDKYNDVYRYTPVNGDVAGLCVRTDELRDAWFSPAGYNRGILKNVVKLAFNPNKAQRDQLYKSGINPVITQPGQGTLLFGDKTLLSKPSAFDRINVRRLFIVLEKAIATAAKFTLFEFNDDFTRAQFRNLVEPFLRDVQGRRGIYDFRVVCDETNNTGEVIDRNEFVGDIYIKPARSINFIQLNFVAVRSGVEFSEVVGQF
jgi:phage tail sheath protein FI